MIHTASAQRAQARVRAARARAGLGAWIDIGGQYQPTHDYIFHPYPRGMGEFLDDRRNRLVVGVLAAGAVVGTALVLFGKSKRRARRA